jgi:signal transduction histidine kinase
VPVNSSTPTPPFARPAYPLAEGMLAPEGARPAQAEAAPARPEPEGPQPRGFSEWLATMSHELRTPLNAIVGYADLMLLGLPHPLPDESRLQVGRMRLAARHLLHLLDEILTFARVEAGQEAPRFASHTLGEIVREAARDLERRATSKRLRVSVSLPESTVTLKTDGDKLRQVLIHLGASSLALTEQGTVTLAGRADGDWAIIEVRDTGAGIEPERLARLFDPSWQHLGGRTDDFAAGASGAGLGLTIAYLLTRLLGGEITVKSRVGIGTTFTVRVPRAAKDGRAD